MSGDREDVLSVPGGKTYWRHWNYNGTHYQLMRQGRKSSTPADGNEVALVGFAIELQKEIEALRERIAGLENGGAK